MESESKCQFGDGLCESISISSPSPPKSKIGMIGVGIFGGMAISLSVIAIPFVSPAFRKVCLPYVPATNEQINNILKALKGRSGKVVDLGSGDGRIVLSVVEKQNLKCTGVELNPWLVFYSKINARLRKMSSKASFIRSDLWKVNLSQYENVVVFGVEEMMPTLESKLVTELHNQGQVIACRFPLPNWKPIRTYGEGLDTVWVYKKPKL